MAFTIIYPFFLKEWKFKKMKTCMIKRIFYTHKKFKRSMKSQTIIEKSSYSH